LDELFSGCIDKPGFVPGGYFAKWNTEDFLEEACAASSHDSSRKSLAFCKQKYMPYNAAVTSIVTCCRLSEWYYKLGRVNEELEDM